MTAVIEPVSPARVTREERTYEEWKTASFFVDLAKSELRADQAATRRLQRHEHEVDVERRASRLNTTTGTGGEFAPPLWAIDKFSLQARAGRTVADLVTNLVLPAGVNAIHTPKETAGPDAGIQSGEGLPVFGVDQTTADASSPVVTIAGETIASQQLFDFTPSPGYDGVIYASLNAAYNQTLERQMLTGTGTGGQLTGVTKISGIGSISGAGVSQTQDTMVQNLWPLIGQACAVVSNNRLLPVEALLFAPRRYYAIASAKDGSQRPLGNVGLSPSVPDASLDAGGAHPVDRLLGVNTYTTGGIIGTSFTAADYIVALRPTDMLLYESEPKYLTSTQSVSGTLQVRLSLHKYAAFIAQKPSAIAVVTAIPQPTNF